MMADPWMSKEAASLYRRGHPGYPEFTATSLLEYYREFMSQRSRIPLALDVACGSGQFSFPLLDVCERVVAVDISAAQIEEGKAAAREKGIAEDRLEFRMGSAYDLVSLELEPDVVSLFSTLHHLKPDKFIKEASMALRPGGVLALYMWQPVGFHGRDGARALSLFSAFCEMVWSLNSQNHDRAGMEALYRGVEIPLDDVTRQERTEVVRMQRATFDTLIRSFSAFIRYRQEDAAAADAALSRFLGEFWAAVGDNEAVDVDVFVISVYARKVIF